MNCHITDNRNKVWERTMTIRELSAIMKKMQKKCVGNWNPKEKIIVLDPQRLDAWKKNSVLQTNKETIDFGGYIRDILPAFLGSAGTAVGIADAMKGHTLFGLQYRWFKWHFVIVEPSGEILLWPVDPTKGPLRKVITVQGFRRYMKYIEREGFFDYIAPSLSREAIERLIGEVKLVAFQAAEEPNDRNN